MYNELYSTPTTSRGHRAFEINLQVRETERKMALHTLNHAGGKSGEDNAIRRTARRIAALMASLF